MPTPVTSQQALKEQIVNSGASSYIIFNDEGQMVACDGMFADEEKQSAAFYVLQHTSNVLQVKEKLRRTTIRFPDCIFVASFVNCGEGTFGVVVQLPPETGSATA